VKGDDRRRHGKNYVTRRVATRSRIVSHRADARISRGDRDAIPQTPPRPPSEPLVASGSARESAALEQTSATITISSLTFAINFPRVARRRALPTREFTARSSPSRKGHPQLFSLGDIASRIVSAILHGGSSSAAAARKSRIDGRIISPVRRSFCVSKKRRSRVDCRCYCRYYFHCCHCRRRHRWCIGGEKPPSAHPLISSS